MTKHSFRQGQTHPLKIGGISRNLVYCEQRSNYRFFAVPAELDLSPLFDTSDAVADETLKKHYNLSIKAVKLFIRTFNHSHLVASVVTHNVLTHQSL